MSPPRRPEVRAAAHKQFEHRIGVVPVPDREKVYADLPSPDARLNEIIKGSTVRVRVAVLRREGGLCIVDFRYCRGGRGEVSRYVRKHMEACVWSDRQAKVPVKDTLTGELVDLA